MVPIPTLPPSLTVKTSVLLSNKFNISPEPLCVIIPAVAVLLVASTLNNSTSLRVVFNVVVSPFTTKFPPIVTFPEKSPVVPSKGPTKLVAVIIPDELILWVCTFDNV